MMDACFITVALIGAVPATIAAVAALVAAIRASDAHAVVKQLVNGQKSGDAK